MKRKIAIALMFIVLCFVSAAAESPKYKLTLKYPDMLNIPPYEREYDAGERVQLEFFLGTHHEIEGTNYVMSEWKEIKAPGVTDDVQIICTPHTNTLTKCEIIMPERPVTLECIWEKCLVVSYKYDQEGKTKASFACQIGDQTPAFLSKKGETVPKRVGHRFAGWSPALSETVKDDVEYIAQWEPLVQVDISQGVRVSYDADYQYFADVVTVNDVELVQGMDYTARQGSTIIEFTPEYLASLSDDIDQMRVETKFVIPEDEESLTMMIPANVYMNRMPENMPETGDESMPGLWFVLLAAAAALLLIRRDAVRR